MKPQISQEDYDALVGYLAECQHDPELFVKLSFPWGEPDTPLENKTGPEKWQLDILREIKDEVKTADVAIREAVASSQWPRHWQIGAGELAHSLGAGYLL